jgi:hypothetical protein
VEGISAEKKFTKLNLCIKESRSNQRFPSLPRKIFKEREVLGVGSYCISDEHHKGHKVLRAAIQDRISGRNDRWGCSPHSKSICPGGRGNDFGQRKVHRI